MKRTFEITDHTEGESHRFTVRVDEGLPWMRNDPLMVTAAKLRLFRELLAWMQADDKLNVSLTEVTK